jgi:ubiquinone/menaquinone biosynthesis C-methylase UbiE
MDFADPGGNLAQFGLGEGKHVADLGAGAGHYSIEAAKAVGNTGRVYAVEVQKELLERVSSLAQSEGLGNVEVLWGDIEVKGGTKLKDESVDVAILSNILFQIEDKKGCAVEVNRILKQKGRVLIIDWEDSYGGLGPAPEAIYGAVSARKLFENMGYVYESDIKAGAHHYGFSMTKV